MIHIQKSNEGIDIPKKDFASINISTNLYFNGREIKRYVNKVHMKIKPSDNALCEDERIDREDCIYKLEELKDIISITIDGETYKAPWKDSKKEYNVNVWEDTKKNGDEVEITIFKPMEKNRK